MVFVAHISIPLTHYLNCITVWSDGFMSTGKWCNSGAFLFTLSAESDRTTLWIWLTCVLLMPSRRILVISDWRSNSDCAERKSASACKQRHSTENFQTSDACMCMHMHARTHTHTHTHTHKHAPLRNTHQCRHTVEGCMKAKKFKWNTMHSKKLC